MAGRPYGKQLAECLDGVSATGELIGVLTLTSKPRNKG